MESERTALKVSSKSKYAKEKIRAKNPHPPAIVNKTATNLGSLWFVRKKRVK
jgi:hypothetical protein